MSISKSSALKAGFVALAIGPWIQFVEGVPGAAPQYRHQSPLHRMTEVNSNLHTSLDTKGEIHSLQELFSKEDHEIKPAGTTIDKEAREEADKVGMARKIDLNSAKINDRDWDAHQSALVAKFRERKLKKQSVVGLDGEVKVPRRPRTARSKQGVVNGWKSSQVPDRDFEGGRKEGSTQTKKQDSIG